MHRKLTIVIVLFFASLAAPQTNATAIEGPFVDYSGGVEIPPDAYAIIITLGTGWDKEKKRYTDRITITISLDGIDVDFHRTALANLGGVAYLEELGDPAGNVRITTIYGHLLTPLPSPLLMSGFDATGWDGKSVLSDETFIGASGTEYHGTPLPFLSVADLPTQFPGFDLSIFNGADPTGRLFAFETIMPLSDVAQVPEPSAMALAMIGGLMVIRRRRHA